MSRPLGRRPESQGPARDDARKDAGDHPHSRSWFVFFVEKTGFPSVVRSRCRLHSVSTERSNRFARSLKGSTVSHQRAGASWIRPLALRQHALHPVSARRLQNGGLTPSCRRYQGEARKTTVDEITLENFRCFREKQIARLAPLTLLVGENSTGKTSFMAMIRALWDVAYRHRIPDFKEEPYDLGSFDEIAHHRGAKGGRAEEIGAGFKTTLTAFPRQGRRADSVPYCFSVTFNKKGTAPIPVTRRFGFEDVQMEIRQDQDRTRLSIATPNGSWELPNTHFIVRLLTTDSDRMPDPSLLMHLMVTGDRNDGTTPIPSGNSGPLTDYDLEQIEQFAFRHGFPVPTKINALMPAHSVRSKPAPNLRSRAPGKRSGRRLRSHVPRQRVFPEQEDMDITQE